MSRGKSLVCTDTIDSYTIIVSRWRFLVVVVTKMKDIVIYIYTSTV